MSIKKSRKNHAKLQYNAKLQLIIHVQHNLNEGNWWRIDGNLGGSSSTFWIWRHRTFIKATLFTQILYPWKAIAEEIPMMVIMLDLVAIWWSYVQAEFASKNHSNIDNSCNAIGQLP